MGNVINDIFDSAFYLYNLNFCAKILSDSVGIPCSRSSILRARLPWKEVFGRWQATATDYDSNP